MAISKTQSIQNFIRTIGQDIQHYRRLVPLLEQQQKLYLQFDGRALSDNLRRQTPLLQQMQQTASQRSSSLRQIGLAADEKGVQRLLNALPTPLKNQVANQWRELQRLVSRCQQLNQQNGHSSANFHEMLVNLTQRDVDTYPDSQPQVG
ncbi:flagellar protein FlgN [Vibrio sp.]|uniref:flagellar protein FlgN n=1 Tax=Vibrio sp. TaxID=678 RepID=UPI003D098CC4